MNNIEITKGNVEFRHNKDSLLEGEAIYQIEPTTEFSKTPLNNKIEFKMITITIDCEMQVDLQNNPSPEVVNMIVTKINDALKSAELSCKPTILAETVKIGEIKDSHEDAKKWYRSLPDDQQSSLLNESPYSGDEDFWDWLIINNEMEIAIHKAYVCQK